MEDQGVSVDAVLEGPIRCPVAPLVPFADHKFPTPSGRFEFIANVELAQRIDAQYPLTLVTNFSKKWLLSQMTEAEHPKSIFVRIGEDVAKATGITNGQMARLSSAVGELTVEVLVDSGVGAGMVIMPVGTWMKRGGGANVLTEDIMSNFGEMAAYGETRVRLEAIEAAPPIDDEDIGTSRRSLDLQTTQ
jgi:anaerobic selenocysteine-containing dehydrogenase